MIRITTWYLRLSDRAGSIVAAVAVVVLAFGLYAPALSAYYFEDDFQWLATTWTFRPQHILDISAHHHFYRPILELYFYGGVRAFGGSAAAFHFFGVAVHAINGMLVYGLVRAITRRASVALIAAMVFISLPGHVDAVAWIGAIGEPLVTMFGCASLWLFIIHLRTGRRVAWAASVLASALALLTHESAVMVLPLLLIAQWVVQPWPLGDRRTWTKTAVAYSPYLVLFGLYAAIEVVVSRQNYLVEQGQYRIGTHAIGHILDYIVWLYVGKRILPSYVAIAVTSSLLMWRGSRAVRFATAWIFLTLLPFAFFIAGNTSRYLYTPAVGFSLLIALAISGVHQSLSGKVSAPVRTAVAGLLTAVVVFRFLFFASDGVRNFVARAGAYQAYLAHVRLDHPVIAPAASVPVPPLPAELHESFAQAMIQWEYHDPGIQLMFTAPVVKP
jgi:hypothetical protein